MATPNSMNQPMDSGIAHDNSGNMQSYSGWTYSYDAQNRLIGATNGATTATFSYDAKNRQIARSINGVITFSVWDEWELVEEYTTGNVRTAAYLQGAHGPVKSLLNNVFYYYQDSLGSTSHIADATGHLLEYYKYDLYGKPTYWNASGTQMTSSAPANNVRDLFSGERWIPELGLYDLRNRYYSPDLGRFLQPDPIGFKGDSSNLYRYCGNDWANRTDPMGLEDQQNRIADQQNLDPAKEPSYASHDRCSNFDRLMNQSAGDLSRVAQNFARQANALAAGVSATLQQNAPRLQALLQRLKSADFVTLSVNLPIPFEILGVSGSVTVDRYGQSYVSPFTGFSFGKGAPFGSASISAGYFNQLKPASRSQLADLLPKGSWNAGGGAFIGANTHWSSQSTILKANSWGFCTPQVGVGYNYSFKGMKVQGWDESEHSQ